MADETVETLKLIWQEIKNLGENLGSRIDATNSRLDATNARLDATNERLEETRLEFRAELRAVGDRIAESEMRVATEVVAMRGAFLEMKEKLTDILKQEARIRKLEDRLAAVERKVG
ncbi:MAG: hypothetical protein IT186_26170 [Acidobacteria bacterium]|nr:hypothetical protein [Acidobacteriota bacterium]MCG3195042.1 hypothetical protein [Thermoanaerobaculia bacterium]MCK6681451.1 hypothetical protein [Thermoanaerobaculia bacterium]